MQRVRCFIAAMGIALASDFASATISSQNPNAMISIIGPEAYNVPAPGDGIGPFVVRLVDPQGQGIEGLTVEFFNNVALCIPLDPHCTLPPPELYGHFEGNLGGEHVLTNDDGVAVSRRYYGGTVAGKYQIAAFVSDLDSARNAQVLKSFPPSIALFDLTQFAAPAVSSVPAFGAFAASVLVAGIVLAAILARLGAGWRKRTPRAHRVLCVRR